MKSLLSSLLVAILVFCVFTSTLAENFNLDNFYPAAAIIVEVNYKTDLVICVDAAGLYWTFEGVEDLQVGDLLSFIMFDNGTPIVYDDEIISYYYSGYVGLALATYWMHTAP